MNTRQHSTASAAIPLLGFLGRHALAVGVTVAAACAVWTVVYIVLLSWAIATGGGLGGPLAYPGGLLVFAGLVLVASLVLYLPATGLAEFVCRKAKKPIMLQIPVSVLFLALLSPVAVASLQWLFPALQLSGSVFMLSAWVVGLSLLPIGLYWWVEQSFPLLAAAFRVLAERRQNKALRGTAGGT